MNAWIEDCRRLAERKGVPLGFHIDVKPVAAMLRHPEYGMDALVALAVGGACFACKRKLQAPAALGLIELAAPLDGVGFFWLCEPCFEQPDFSGHIGRAVQRELGMAEDQLRRVDYEPASIPLASTGVTLLRCAPGHRATKRVTMGEGGQVQVEGYDAGTWFGAAELQVSGIASLGALLTRVSSDPRTFVIRGQRLPETDPLRCRRLLYRQEDGTPPTFRDVLRRWVVLDFDNVPGPYRFDTRDGALAARYCRTLLPEPWQRCSYWWGLSASAGFKPGVRIKLAFWLDRSWRGAELERHLAGSPIDASTLRAVQPIYVAAPILGDGVEDPIAQRTGIEQDISDQVVLPELPAEVRPERTAHSAEGFGYVSGNDPTVAEKRLEPLCRAVERAGVGRRHRCLIWAAARAVELDDAMSREAIAKALMQAARNAGLDDSEAELLRHVRNGFKIGIFGAEAAP